MNNSSTVCVDANVIVRFVLFNEQTIKSLWDSWTSKGVRLVAPTLLHYEVVNSLYQYVKHGKISKEAFRDSIEIALTLPVELISEDNTRIHSRAAFLATQYKLPAAYDAHYLALCEQMGIEFWTADARLFNTLKPLGIDWVKLVGE